MGHLGWPAEMGEAASCADGILTLLLLFLQNYWGLEGGLGVSANPLNPGFGNGRTLRSPTGEIGLSEIQIVFVKVSICPETMK